MGKKESNPQPPEGVDRPAPPPGPPTDMVHIDTLPQCDGGCGAHFHMTGGHHLRTCSLYRYDRAIGRLEFMKIMILSGEKIPQSFVDDLSDFIEAAQQ